MHFYITQWRNLLLNKTPAVSTTHSSKTEAFANLKESVKFALVVVPDLLTRCPHETDSSLEQEKGGSLMSPRFPQQPTPLAKTTL